MATVVTKTIKPGGGGDYTTLAAWQTARMRALTDTIETAVCFYGDCGAFAQGAAWSADSNSYIHVVADAASRHVGVFDTTKAHIKSTSSVPCVSISANGANIVFEGLVFDATLGNECVLWVAGAKYKLKSCIGKCTIASGVAFRRPIYAENTVVFGTMGYGFSGDTGAAFYNCTSVGASISGFYSTAGVLVKNCLANNCADGFSGSFSAASDYNCSDIAGDAPGAHSVTGTVQFKDAANKDFHLAATDTVARGAGTNLTASGITTDIDGQARPATDAWDIGADQYVAPAPTGPWGTPKFGISQPFGAQKFGVTPWM